ncbi:VWA domain-containing protein [Hydrogenimonas sp. SS33]|uniref:vWA domain-containing protein n=1 Tax=Hydrogenimonas leucolamina TaxID=2954236 RepID=UPI00336C2B8C
MITFWHPWVLVLLLLLPLLWFWGKSGGSGLRRHFSDALYRKMVSPGSGMSRNMRRLLLLGAMGLAIVALARPVIERGEIKVKEPTSDLMVAFDISRSMFADDIYPNRFEFAKRKFYELLDDLKRVRVGVVGFSSRAFLIAPLTEDFESLKYLVKHMSLDYVSLRGTDMMAPLEVTENLLKNKKQKALLLFTDGGDNQNFDKEIAYAKNHGIKVFVYAVATPKGGVMKTGNGVVRDEKGDIVVTKLNPAIAELAEATGGVYMPFGLGNGDMRRMARAIESRLKPAVAKEETIHDRVELFVYPLAGAILLFLAGISSLPRRKRQGA